MLETITINQLETQILISHLLVSIPFGKRETHRVFTPMEMLSRRTSSSKGIQLGHLNHVSPSKVNPAFLVEGVAMLQHLGCQFKTLMHKQPKGETLEITTAMKMVCGFKNCSNTLLAY